MTFVNELTFEDTHIKGLNIQNYLSIYFLLVHSNYFSEIHWSINKMQEAYKQIIASCIN